jgi:hypothetical protein
MLRCCSSSCIKCLLIVQDVDKESRVKVLRGSLEGGAGDLPGSDTDSLVTAASQFIDEMEDQMSILDR